MPTPKKLTDTQRNWNIAKQYVKESPSLPNILKALKYFLDGPKPQIVKDSKGNSWFEFAIPQNMQQMELSYKQGGIL